MSTSLRQPGREILSICGAGVSSHVNSGIAAPSLSTISRLKAAMRAMFPAMSARAASHAAPKAAIAGMASVPARRPPSCAPPIIYGRRRSPSLTYSAPMPLGACILCPLTLIMSAPRLFGLNGSFMKACTASVCTSAALPARLNSPDIAEISVTAPVSLLTSIKETSIVSSRRASITACGLIAPVPSGLSSVTSKPRRRSSSRVLRTASCSTDEEIMCRPFRAMTSAPERSAQLSLSEPQEVKTTSPGRHPSAAAACPRAVSSSFFASRPRVCVELGLP